LIIVGLSSSDYNLPSNSSGTKDKPLKRLDIVIPVYNEADCLTVLYRRLLTVLSALEYETRIVFVDDGSKDETVSIIREWVSSNPQISLIELSRNFGHQNALTAGLDFANGDVVLTMDGDGQHPPELIPDLLKLYEKGNDIVLTQRLQSEGASTFKDLTSRGFYSLISQISDIELIPASADFRLLSRSVVLGMRGMREQHRFLRGMVAWMGYQVAIYPFTAPQRIAGSSKYSILKMLRFARDAIFSFSLAPVWFSFILGGIFLLFSFFEILYVLSFWLTGNHSQLEPGWSSLMFVTLFMGGLLFVLLGIIGYYTGLIFQEVKRRPLYFVRNIYPAPGSSEATQQEGS
jgi:polyisoprenyl-phosphate glycosyltransferase